MIHSFHIILFFLMLSTLYTFLLTNVRFTTLFMTDHLRPVAYSYSYLTPLCGAIS